jgi:hypothetical protein
MTKRALLIAFHFPPQAASSGIQRSLSFSRHLRQFGWEPMVLTAHPRAYEQQNPSQLRAIPADLPVTRAFALDTKRHLGYRNRYPSLLAVPDRWVSWGLAGIPAGLKMIREQRPDVIWSTFPIASAHLIALALHRLTGLPWIADFRDPMLQPDHPSGRWQRWAFGRIERQVIERCHTAVFTTHRACEWYRTRFPHLPAEKFVVIENGYDEDGFASALGTLATPAAPAGAGDTLTLLHSGVLYDAGRDPSAFMRAVAALVREGLPGGKRLRVVLRAPGNMEGIRALAEQFGVADVVEVAPAVPYAQALAEMLAADGLLVFQGSPFNNQVPAKIYEYFRARRPILGLVDPGGETARVLGLGGFHSLVDIDDSNAILPVLRRFVADIASGQAHCADDVLVAASSRAHRARQLADLMAQAVRGPVPAEAY